MKIKPPFFQIIALFLGIHAFSLDAGFVAGTLVHTTRGLVPIEKVTPLHHVYCMDKNNNETSRPVMITRRYNTHELYRITINDTVITCDAEQMFYAPDAQTWLAARTLIPKETPAAAAYVYDLHVKECHNFFVTEHKILAHNAAIAIPIIAFGGGEITFLVGAALKTMAAGICGAVFWNFLKSTSDATTTESPDFIGFDVQNKIDSPAQAPGIPTENDGYYPPKKWDGEKVKNPNGSGYGYPDKKGNVWIPTGPKGHGCPHWDVQRPDGKHNNVVPGGKIRGQK